jgi:hypothetical protein
VSFLYFLALQWYSGQLSLETEANIFLVVASLSIKKEFLAALCPIKENFRECNINSNVSTLMPFLRDLLEVMNSI